MDAKQLAEKLTGREYPFDPTDAEAKAAKDSGLLIVFGSSDDLMEFRGAFTDEVGAYEGATARIDVNGLVPDYEQVDKDDKDALRDYFRRENGGSTITALWCKEGNYSWTFQTAIPHATFEIQENGDPYSRGIVLSMDTLK